MTLVSSVVLTVVAIWANFSVLDDLFFGNCDAALTIPVGTAIVYPKIIINAEMDCPSGVVGGISTYPTVVRMTIVQ